MKITDIRAYTLVGDADAIGVLTEERQVGQLDAHAEFRSRGPSQPGHVGPDGKRVLEHSYVEIDTDEGVGGIFGPINEEQAIVIIHRLRSFLIGRDPLAHEQLWDMMYRHDRHARKGLMMMAVSAVDNALWDLRGKLRSEPVYRLLGGPTRDRVQAYASMLGHSLEVGPVYQRAQETAEAGYWAQKWFFRYGPGDGIPGMLKNMDLVRTVREAINVGNDIMFDCWMGWDYSYAARMLEQIGQYNVRWVEEPLSPDRIAEYAALRSGTNVPLATGEHEYTRWGFHQLLQADAVDVIQADPDWAGGLTEMVKICTLASTYGKPVIPHGHSVLPALHLIASQPELVCPMAEFLIKGQRSAQYFHKDFVEPVEGYFALPTKPGLGIELDESKILRRVEVQ